MKDFQTFCSHFSPLSERAMTDLMTHISEKKYGKEEFLFRSGETCRYLFFLQKGLVKITSYREEKEFVMRFFSEGLMFSEFSSFLTQTPSKFNMIALEPTEMIVISHKAIEELCRNHHEIETFFRKLLSIATVKMVKRINEMLEENATERYRQFVKENESIIQRISLGDLAQYLGITQQSLSRIRAVR